jgi:signal transduction histidine kinase
VKIRTKTKIIVLLIAFLILAVSLNVAWSVYAQTKQAKEEMLEKTQVLDQEMRAVWDFIDINQKRIDTDSNGEYFFKNIYCAIAGKSVAKLFMQQNDYEIRFVSFKPRYSNAYPDAFEAAALKQFGADSAVDEHFDITNYNERGVFRYASPIRIKESCLSCHGEPAGEKDVTGHVKEGLAVGDIAGAMSIIMPIDLYMEGILTNIWQQSLYFFIVLSVLIIITYIAITHLVRRLEKANANLQHESQHKSDFLATMSHEFRTPLTAILAFADILGRPDSKASPSDREAVAEVRHNGQILLHMVNNILEVARSDSAREEMNYEMIEMVDMISTIEATVRPLVERRDIKFTTTVMPDVPLISADWEKLRRIIENLVSNAIKFTKRGGAVETIVRLAAAGSPVSSANSEKSDGGAPGDRGSWSDGDAPSERGSWSDGAAPSERGSWSDGAAPGDRGSWSDGGAWIESDSVQNCIAIVVRDTGIGIKPEDIPHVFEKFVQLDKSAFRRYNGTGLGLAVVKELTEAHGGSVYVQSLPKFGSTFTVFIPINGEEL